MSLWDRLEIGSGDVLGSHTFAADDIKRFAAKYDPQVFHLDEDAAARSTLGGLCASGWHTAAVYMHLNVDFMKRQAAAAHAAGLPLPRFGPSPGFRNLRWLKPVYAGDTITYSHTITAKRVSASRPGWGVVEMSVLGVNQNDVPVFSFDGAAFIGTD